MTISIYFAFDCVNRESQKPRIHLEIHRREHGCLLPAKAASGVELHAQTVNEEAPKLYFKVPMLVPP